MTGNLLDYDWYSLHYYWYTQTGRSSWETSSPVLKKSDPPTPSMVKYCAPNAQVKLSPGGAAGRIVIKDGWGLSSLDRVGEKGAGGLKATLR